MTKSRKRWSTKFSPKIERNRHARSNVCALKAASKSWSSWSRVSQVCSFVSTMLFNVGINLAMFHTFHNLSNVCKCSCVSGWWRCTVKKLFGLDWNMFTLARIQDSVPLSMSYVAQLKWLVTLAYNVAQLVCFYIKPTGPINHLGYMGRETSTTI